MLPKLVKQTVEKMANQFFQKYDNPIYCLDFGMGEDGPLIFENKDQMGYPTREMEDREGILEA